MTLTAREYDHNGWAEIKRNPISKVGVFPYKGKNISNTLEPETIYMVYRPAEELAKQSCIDSFKLLPWIDLHPRKLLGPELVGRVPTDEKGIDGIIGQDVVFDDGVLYANIKLFSDQLDGKIEDGLRELSAGYACTYELSSGVYNGQRYDAIQRNIRGNHLASVPNGRMGPDVSVLDHLTFTMDAKDINIMTEEEKKMKECADRAAADGFKRYGKDADEEKKDKEAADKMAADKAAKDASEEAEAKAQEKKDAEAKDAEEDEKKDKKEGMDAMDAQITNLKSQVETLQKDGFKAVLRDLAKRDALAATISEHVGVFDHAEMTPAEVAAYGVSKLGLKCAAGNEMAALDGYFHNRKSPSDEVGFALDAGGSDSSDFAQSDIAKFYNPTAA